MSFDLNDDQRAFQETARRFAREKLASGYQRREAEGRIDRALVREMGDLGLIAPELPEEFGGLGTASLTSGLIAEAIGYADVNAAYIQILGVAQRQDHRRSRPAGAGAAMVATSGFRRGHRGDRPHRTARRIGRRQSRAVRPPRRRPLHSQRREILDQHGRPGRRRRGVRADRARRRRRARRQRLPRADGHAGRHDAALQRSRQQGDRPQLDLFRRRRRSRPRTGWPTRAPVSSRSCRVSISAGRSSACRYWDRRRRRSTKAGPTSRSARRSARRSRKIRA